MNSLGYALLAACTLGSWGSGQAPQIALDAAFENGKLDGWSYDGTHYSINTNNAPGAWQWLHFRATGVSGRTPWFKTATTTSNDVYRSFHRMVWRYEGSADWQQMDFGDKPGDGFYYFHNSAPFVGDVVYVAYWLPYTYTQMLEFVKLLPAQLTPQHGDAVEISAGIVGASAEGRTLLRVTVGDRSVATPPGCDFVFVARQHGYESLGNYALEGLLQYLLSADASAVQLRRRGRFHFYPMANPDAVVNGWTREGRARNGITPVDFNRDWLKGSVATGGAPSASWEIDFLRNDIVLQTGGSAVVVIDLHSHAKGSTGLGWYWHHHDDPAAAMALITEVWNRDLAAHGGQTIYSWPQLMAGANSTTLGAWGSSKNSNTIGTLEADSFTLEPIAAPFGAVRSADRIRAAGAALGRAIAALY